MQPFKIQIKLGQFEFSAEGSEATVKEQLESFMKLVNAAPEIIPTPNKLDSVPQNGAQKPETKSLSDDLAKIFLKENEALTLRIHPEGERKAEQARDAFILLLYGFKQVFQQEDFKTMDLTDALKKSGVKFFRLGEVADPLYKEGMITKSGQFKGTRYRITNKGIQAAEKIIEQLRSRF